MISRRLLRIKALQILYAYHMSESPSLSKTEKELLFSVEKSYQLYLLVLILILEIADYAENRIEIKRSKHFPTAEEANPNTRFIENPIVDKLRNNEELLRYISQNHLSWVNHPELAKHLYHRMIGSPEYEEYMASSSTGFNHHKDFINFLVSEIIANDEYLDQVLEEISIYWNDDIDFAAGMALKTLDRCSESKQAKLFPMFKDDEDRQFLINLFRKSVVKEEEIKELINRFTKNWDFDRVAVMDILIMQMAITEAMEFPSIPTKVTLNEYIEIAKYYSTEKSSLFINGILDKTFQTLKTEKKIKKTGRGLVGETELS